MDESMFWAQMRSVIGLPGAKKLSPTEAVELRKHVGLAADASDDDLTMAAGRATRRAARERATRRSTPDPLTKAGDIPVLKREIEDVAGEYASVDADGIDRDSAGLHIETMRRLEVRGITTPTAAEYSKELDVVAGLYPGTVRADVTDDEAELGREAHERALELLALAGREDYTPDDYVRALDQATRELA